MTLILVFDKNDSCLHFGVVIFVFFLRGDTIPGIRGELFGFLDSLVRRYGVLTVVRQWHTGRRAFSNNS